MTFFIVFSTFLAIIYLYAGFRLIPFMVPKKFLFPSWLCLAGAYVTLIGHLILRVTYNYPMLSHIFAWTGYIGLGIVSYLVILVLIRDLIFMGTFLFSRVKLALSGKPSVGHHNPRRRQFLLKSTGLAITAASAGAAGIGYAAVMQAPKVVRIPVPLNPRDKALAGLTIAQFTDLHIGPTVKYSYVNQVCQTISQLNADIIVFTGDLVDGSPLHLIHDVTPLMNLEAPLGKYFVTGNHEYYSGAKRWLHMVSDLGFKPLINTHRIIRYNRGKMVLAGVTDIRASAFFKSHTSSVKKAIAGCPADAFKLLLAHQPTSVYEAASLGVNLQLSGHTHGGQYFPLEFFILLEHPFIKGMHQYKNTRLYVSQGTGYWGPPLRLGTFPEVTLFTLT